MTKKIEFDLLARDKASPVFDKFGRQVKSTDRDVRGLKVGLGTLAAGFAGLQVVDRVTDTIFSSVKGASDLNETLNLNQVIFKADAKAMVQWSKTSDTAFGLSQQSALQATGQFGDMFNQLGFGRDESVKMSKEVVGLAADLGSFKNLPTADVLERISAGFRGEYDSLQMLIPNISAARVEKEAMAATGKRQAAALTAEEKAAATLAIIQKDGAAAAGDFARTSDGLANSQKILNAEWENSKAALGESLLPVATEAVDFLRTKGIPAFDDFGKWFAGEGVPALKEFGQEVGPVARDVLPVLGTGLKVAADSLSVMLPPLQAALDLFNSLPKSLQSAILVGGGVAAVGKRAGVTLPALIPAGGGSDKPGKSKGKGKSKGGASAVGWNLPTFALGVGIAANPKNDLDTIKRLNILGDNVKRFAVTMNTYGQPTAATVKALRTELQQGVVGKYAEEYGISIDKLAESLARGGTEGEYAAEVLRNLDSQFSPVAGLAGSLVPFETDSENIDMLRHAIRNMGIDLDEAGEAAERTGGKTRSAGQEIADSLGISADQARALGIDLDNLGAKRPTPRVSVPGAAKAGIQIGSLGANLDSVDGKKANPKVSAPGAAGADRKIRSIGSYLPILDGMRANPKVNVGGNFSSAFAKLSRLGDKIAAISAGANAQGTEFFEGGLTWVGEEGPELLALPRSSKIYSNQRSQAMAVAGSRARSGAGPSMGTERSLDGSTIQAIGVAVGMAVGRALPSGGTGNAGGQFRSTLRGVS